MLRKAVSKILLAAFLMPQKNIPLPYGKRTPNFWNTSNN